MNIKELRLKSGLSQQELSDKTGIPKSRIGQWEIDKAKPKKDDYDTLNKFFIKIGVIGKDDMVTYDLGSAIRKIEKTTEVILSAVSEILARQTNQTATVVRGQLESLVNERLNSKEQGQEGDEG